MSAVKDETVGAYLEALASTAAVPGGGSAAALAAAMGTALLSMVAKLSAKRAKRDDTSRRLIDLVPQLDALTVELRDLSQRDIDAYRAVIEARKAGAARDLLDHAYERAAEVPLATATAASQGLALAVEVSQHTWEMVVSDLAVANALLESGLGGALGNVAVNLPELSAAAAERIEPRYLELRGRHSR